MNPAAPEPVVPSESNPPSGAAGEAAIVSPGSRGVAPGAGSKFRMWSIALTAGFTAGMISWGIGEVMLVPETRLIGAKGTNTLMSLAAENIRGATIASGILGAVMAACAGIAGGVARRSILWTVLAGTTGLILGGGSGMIIAKWLVPGYYEHVVENDLTYTLIVHGGIWAGLGAVAGLVLAIGLGGGWGRMLRLIVGCAAAALLAAFIFDVVGATMFPLAMTDHPVSQTWQTRLLAQLLVTMFVAVGAVLVMDPIGKPRGAEGAGA